MFLLWLLWGWTTAARIVSSDRLNFAFNCFDLDAKYIAKYLLSTFNE